MKKLFVLFLLVALVPFTVGCSLWGGDDEPVTYPPSWTAKVTAPAASSLRGATPVKYAGYTITINGVTLPIVDETGTLLTFSKVLETSAEVAAKAVVEAAGNEVTIVISDNSGTPVETITVITKAADADTITIDISGAKPEVEVGGVEVIAAASDSVGTIESVVCGGVTLSDAATVYTVVPADNKLVFTITSNVDFDITKGYDYVVKVNDKAVAAADFTLTQTAKGKTATITLDSSKRVAGTTYKVVITSLIVDGINVGAKTFQFKF